MHRTLDERLDGAISSQFTVRLMSNAKWRKAFLTLGDAALGLTRFTFKEVSYEHEADTSSGRNARPPCDEFEVYMRLDRLPKPDQIGERRTADCLSGGPLYYRAIEWIEIPARYVVPAAPKIGRERQVVQQDVVAAARALSEAGRFPIELTDERLRLYGYG